MPNTIRERFSPSSLFSSPRSYVFLSFRFNFPLTKHSLSVAQMAWIIDYVSVGLSTLVDFEVVIAKFDCKCFIMSVHLQKQTIY